MDLTPEMRELIIRTAKALPLGAQRRRYVADTVETLRLGAPRPSNSSAGDATPSARHCANDAPV